MITPAAGLVAGRWPRVRRRVGLQLHLAVRRCLGAAVSRRSAPGRRSSHRATRPARAGPSGIGALAAALRRGRYAAAFLGPPSLRAALVTLLAGHPASGGPGRPTAGASLLTRPLPRLPTRRSAPQPGNARARAALLGGAGLAGVAACSAMRRRSGRPALPGCGTIAACGRRSGRPLWVVGPGATYGQAKTWPRDADWRISCAWPCEERGARVVLLGDPGAARVSCDRPARRRRCGLGNGPRCRPADGCRRSDRPHRPGRGGRRCSRRCAALSATTAA